MALPGDRQRPTDVAWEVYDMNLAGCLLCGEMHVCMVSSAASTLAFANAHRACCARTDSAR